MYSGDIKNALTTLESGVLTQNKEKLDHLVGSTTCECPHVSVSNSQYINRQTAEADDEVLNWRRMARLQDL